MIRVISVIDFTWLDEVTEVLHKIWERALNLHQFIKGHKLQVVQGVLILLLHRLAD